MTVLAELPDGYVVSDDRARLDLDMIWRFLHEESYWARDRSREVVERGIAHAFPVGAYAADGSQAGFAMAVTDRAVFALLANVFVLQEHRGRGLGEAMVGALLHHAELATVTRWILSTDDAHGLYAKFGFEPAPQTPAAMELRRAVITPAVPAAAPWRPRAAASGASPAQATTRTATGPDTGR